MVWMDAPSSVTTCECHEEGWRYVCPAVIISMTTFAREYTHGRCVAVLHREADRRSRITYIRSALLRKPKRRICSNSRSPRRNMYGVEEIRVIEGPGYIHKRKLSSLTRCLIGVGMHTDWGIHSWANTVGAGNEFYRTECEQVLWLHIVS